MSRGRRSRRTSGSVCGTSTASGSCVGGAGSRLSGSSLSAPSIRPEPRLRWSTLVRPHAGARVRGHDGNARASAAAAPGWTGGPGRTRARRRRARSEVDEPADRLTSFGNPSGDTPTARKPARRARPAPGSGHPQRRPSLHGDYCRRHAGSPARCFAICSARQPVSGEAAGSYRRFAER